MGKVWRESKSTGSISAIGFVLSVRGGRLGKPTLCGSRPRRSRIRGMTGHAGARSEARPLAGALVTAALLVLAFTSVFSGGKTLRNGPGMPGVVPFGAEGATTVVTKPHTMDTVPAFIDEPLARLMSRQIAAGDPPL